VIGERWIGAAGRVGLAAPAPLGLVMAGAPATTPPVLIASAGAVAHARTIAALTRTDKLP
jgi:hypothetical protein